MYILLKTNPYFTGNRSTKGWYLPVKYAIRFLAVAAVLCALEECCFQICRQAFQRSWTQPQCVYSLPPKSESIPRVTAQLEITVEEYDTASETLLSAEPYWDVRLAGMDEEELYAFLQEPRNMGSGDDFAKGYYGAVLTRFDREGLCIRKLYRISRKGNDDI